ncbi:hypothetical protein PUNSTDRAFT_46433 [Punctularia strigosozonata HHB-11173 SS5]|uniref:uncharacterized protein n=1 Tax=Punctularia strigosozonata (strain HHB-11173) TaxID=741275 RepID=UPI0004416D35|nr:uncharacterized protein PUNSTDRAFT_46433 [Punctularia strigosozonata HHB-11173 SS5]EIN06214.1 hypothetical protein PUNSTDRAFT_46433 [Punctularia strigosozonata HHB-11173 SS5]
MVRRSSSPKLNTRNSFELLRETGEPLVNVKEEPEYEGTNLLVPGAPRKDRGASREPSDPPDTPSPESKVDKGKGRMLGSPKSDDGGNSIATFDENVMISGLDVHDMNPELQQRALDTYNAALKTQHHDTKAASGSGNHAGVDLGLESPSKFFTAHREAVNVADRARVETELLLQDALEHNRLIMEQLNAERALVSDVTKEVAALRQWKDNQGQNPERPDRARIAPSKPKETDSPTLGPALTKGYGTSSASVFGGSGRYSTNTVEDKRVGHASIMRPADRIMPNSSLGKVIRNKLAEVKRAMMALEILEACEQKERGELAAARHENQRKLQSGAPTKPAEGSRTFAKAKVAAAKASERGHSVTKPEGHKSATRTSWPSDNDGRKDKRPVRPKRLSDEDKKAYIADGRCFDCGQTGHMSRNCPGMHQVKGNRKKGVPPGVPSYAGAISFGDSVELADGDELLTEVTSASVRFVTEDDSGLPLYMETEPTIRSDGLDDDGNPPTAILPWVEVTYDWRHLARLDQKAEYLSYLEAQGFNQRLQIAEAAYRLQSSPNGLQPDSDIVDHQLDPRFWSTDEIGDPVAERLELMMSRNIAAYPHLWHVWRVIKPPG